MKTLQEAFDIVVAHARTQGGVSVSEGGAECRYVNEDGLKCFVGVLIEPEYYSEGLEGEDTSASLALEALEASGWPIRRVKDVNFYLDLQGIHDNVCVDSWETEFRFIADKYRLEYEDA